MASTIAMGKHPAPQGQAGQEARRAVRAPVEGDHGRLEDGRARSGDEPAPASRRGQRQGASVPKDNIQRAIDKGQSARAPTLPTSAMKVGPGGVGIIIEAATDNKNRTATDVRSAFTKSGGAPRHHRLGLVHLRPARRDRISGQRRLY